MFGWYPSNSELGFNPPTKDWFFEYGSQDFLNDSPAFVSQPESNSVQMC